MMRTRDVPISFIVLCALSVCRASDDADAQPAPANPQWHAAASNGNSTDEIPAAVNVDVQQSAFFETLTKGDAQYEPWIAPKSAQFPRANQIPNTEIWWKFGGYVKGDFIHDFQPAGTTDRFVPITIPTDDVEGQNTLMQAKATRLNLDVRAPTDWGTARGFVETDFFTSDNTLRIPHAYAEVGDFLVGQTWSGFTDPDSIPRTLDFESPIAFITTRQAQFRWTRSIGENLKWAVSIENPNTDVEDVVMATIPGVPEQPLPDFVTRLKYKTEGFEWFAAGLFRELTYRPDLGPAQHRFGWATNLVGIVRPTEADKLMAQFIFGSGLGRYRSGFDLRLENPTTVETINHAGYCFSLTHTWTKTLSSTLAHSIAMRSDEDFDPPDTLRRSSYTAVNLIWEPIDNTSFGIEYLYGTNETKDEAFGSANRIQVSVQYNFP